MELPVNQLLAQGADWLESIVVLGVIALSVLSNVANAWIKRAKEKKENQRRAGQAPPPPSAPPRQAPRPAFPTAKPWVPKPSAPPQQVRPAPARKTPRPTAPPTTGIPRELLPEGLEEVLGEMLPDFLRPKKPSPPPPQQSRAPQPKPTKAQPTKARPAPPPQARKRPTKRNPPVASEAGSSEDGDGGASGRLGNLQSSFDVHASQTSTVADHVASHISHLEHPVPDAAPSTTGGGPKSLSRQELRHAIVMSEILGRPRALRPFDDLV